MTSPRITLALGLLLAAAGCGDSASVEDGATTDGGADGRSSEASGPLANVYKVNPIEDKKTTSVVKLEHLTSTAGKLSGKYADVWNCLQEAGGDKIDVSLAGMTFTGKMCHLAQKATRGKDGTYLHIKPPASDADGNDSFAEVMMYHHVTRIHGHYTGTFGLKHLESKKLRSVVNVTAYVDLLARWMGIMNAAFVPKETGSVFKIYFGVDLNKGEDAIIFSQDSLTSTVDPSYDAAVIYHEYTHAALGAAALYGSATDQYGLDPTPIALNEALADYLPSSYIGSPKMGTYALGTLGATRDLTRVLKCPGHITGEEHNDGEIASGTFWSMRQILGATNADKAIWNAVLTFTKSTTYSVAAQAILDEIKKLDPTKEAAVKQLFVERGLLDCVRLTDHKDFENLSAKDAPRYPGALSSTFPNGTPAYLQYKVAIADTTKEIAIEYVPSGGSFMGFPIGTGKGNVWVALKKGSTPITYTYSGGLAASTASHSLQGADTTSGYKLLLSGDCVSKGDLVFQFLSKDISEGTLTKVKVTQSSTKTRTTDNFTGCP